MQDKANKLYNVDNIEFLRTLPDKSISACISDVPYALCDIDALKMIKEDMQNKSDFMGRSWKMPTIPFLKECNRVLKDGAFFVTTFSPRADLQCVFSYRLLEAGFDINFTPILWCFASGFPKASDYSKMADRRAKAKREVVGEAVRIGDKKPYDINSENGFHKYTKSFITKPTTPEAKYLDGLKSLQLKPSYETIIIAQKPYKAKSKIDQALVWYNERRELLDKGIKEEDLYLYTKNASGGVRIDKGRGEYDFSTRIPIESEDFDLLQKKASKEFNGITIFDPDKKGTALQPNTDGRFPATILTGSPIDFCEEDILDLHTTQTTSPILFELLDYIGLTLDDFKALSKEELQGVIAKLKKPLDVGRERKATSYCLHSKEYTLTNKVKFVNQTNGNDNNTYSDQGDLSRYFSLDTWTKKNLPELYKVSKKTLELQEDAEKISPFLFTSKADKGSKNAGLEGFEKKENCQRDEGQAEFNVPFKNRPQLTQNTHPTGKPISLYTYLINLFTQPHDLVLDPYCGSGTTPIACVLTNRHYIGLELEKEYFDIAEARVKFWKEQKEWQASKTSKEEGSLI